MDTPADIIVPAPGGPLSPWLRLAHVTTYPGGSGGEQAQLRTLLDFELILVLTGTAWIHLEASGRSVAMPTGTVALLPPGVVHCHRNRGHSHLAVHFDLVAQTALEPMAMIRYAGALRTPGPPVPPPRVRLGDTGPGWDLVTRVADPGLWRARLGRLVHFYRLRRHREPTAQLEATEILSWAVRELTAVGTARAAADPRVVAAMEAVERDLARPWPIRALRRRCGLGDTALRAAFIAAVGMPPRAWIERRRCELAARLLVESARSVGDVARACGWSDPLHFSRVFRRVHGLPPTAFRARAGWA